MTDGPLPPPGPHGGDARRVAEALGRDPNSIVDLSVSMNPFAPPVAALAATHLDELTRYPDPTDATALLAAALEVDTERLVLTNGGAEAIALVAQLVGVGEVVEPEFSLYRRHLPRVSPDGPRWRSNPSNPLGLLASPDERAGVWDEAFYQLATGTWTRRDEDAWRLGSLTKLWNCPGLRLGYVIAPSAEAAEQVRARQPRWSVNGLALGLLGSLLEATDLPVWTAQVGELRRDLRDRLVELGFNVRDTTVNWLLVDEPALRDRLAPHGVLVRDCASFGMHGTFRVGLPHPDHLQLVSDAFAKVREAVSPSG